MPLQDWWPPRAYQDAIAEELVPAAQAEEKRPLAPRSQAGPFAAGGEGVRSAVWQGQQRQATQAQPGLKLCFKGGAGAGAGFGLVLELRGTTMFLSRIRVPCGNSTRSG